MKTKDLVFMAMYVAMFAVLEYLGRTLAILQMPMGEVYHLVQFH